MHRFPSYSRVINLMQGHRGQGKLGEPFRDTKYNPDQVFFRGHLNGRGGEAPAWQQKHIYINAVFTLFTLTLFCCLARKAILDTSICSWGGNIPADQTYRDETGERTWWCATRPSNALNAAEPPIGQEEACRHLIGRRLQYTKFIILLIYCWKIALKIRELYSILIMTFIVRNIIKRSSYF